VDSIKSEIEKLKYERDAIHNMTDDARRNLAKCLQAWAEYEKSLKGCDEWLQAVKDKLEEGGLGFICLDEQSPAKRMPSKDMVAKAKVRHLTISDSWYNQRV
jgi:hypothetical protein